MGHVEKFVKLAMKIKIAVAMRGGTTYAYDGNGNIISADNASYQYDSQNRLTEALVNSQPVGIYSYDAQSRRVKKVAYGVTTYFIYDQFSNLIAESDANGNITREYIYLNGQPLALIDLPLPSSAPPQTISQQVSMGCSSIFVWDPKEGVLGYALILSPFFFLIFFQVTRNWKKSGALLLVVLSVSFAISLVVVHKAKAQEAGEKIYYYHNDHLGTPIKLTDQNQNVVWTWQYGPFGEEPLTMNSNTISQNLRFPGQYYDAETGLNYNFHRYYSPKLGGYLTPDPQLIEGEDTAFVHNVKSDAKDLNPFVYVNSNPINYVDILGLELISPQDGNEIVMEAWTWQGVPYRENAGRNSNRSGTDCSGLVWNVYNEVGYPYDYLNTESFRNESLNKKFKPQTSPQEGDVALWSGHMGIYSGGIIISARSGLGKVAWGLMKWFNERYKFMGFYRYDKPCQ